MSYLPMFSSSSVILISKCNLDHFRSFPWLLAVRGRLHLDEVPDRLFLLNLGKHLAYLSLWLYLVDPLLLRGRRGRWLGSRCV